MIALLIVVFLLGFFFKTSLLAEVFLALFGLFSLLVILTIIGASILVIVGGHL